MAHLTFDGNGRVEIPAWQPVVKDDFRVLCKYRHTGDYEGFYFCSNADGTRNITNIAGSGRPIRIKFRTSTSSAVSYDLGDAVDGFDSATVTTVEIVVTPGFAEAYLNESVTPIISPVPIEPTAGLADWVVEVLGSSGADVCPIGYELHEVQLIDPNTASNANDSIYLFDQTGGTTLVDTGGRAADGTLVGFTQEPWSEAAGSPAPTITIPETLTPGANFTINFSAFVGEPVSPVTITDSAGNSITAAVTVSSTVAGDGTYEGTATGVMPSLPASGTQAGILFGDVTVELTT